MAKTKNKKTATTSRKNTARKDNPSMVKACCGVLLVGIITFGGFALYERSKAPQNQDLQDIADTNTASLGEAYNNANNDVEKDTSENSGNGEGLAEKEMTNNQEEKSSQYEYTENNKKVANVMINYAYQSDSGNIEASGEVVNISNTEGTCTYRFSKGDEVVEESTGVLPSPKSTVCKALTLAGNKLSAGEWKLNIKYNSEYAEGESEAIHITVQ